jgi:Uma2 family endonuclease
MIQFHRSRLRPEVLRFTRAKEIVDMSSLPEYRLSPDEYLALERTADHRSEYIDGYVVAMAGGSEPHNVIVGNLVTLLNLHLREKPCRVFPSDMKVHRVDSTRYFYPDVTVVCGESHFSDDNKDVLLNPILLIEVLSEETESFDRGTKFKSYLRLSSLLEYVLVSQSSPVVERYSRQGTGDWLYSRLEGLDRTVTFTSVGLIAKLADIFNKAI